MVRIARLIALALFCVLLAVVPVALVIFWPAIRSTVRPGRRAIVPQVVRPPVAQSPAAPVVLSEPPPPRKGNKTWADVEASFTEMQTHRDEHPEWVHDLAATYSMVANPAYTDSLNLIDHCVKLAAWHHQVPDSPTALVAVARAHIDWAWEARGPWLASSVTEEGWEKYHTQIAEARRLLEQAIEMGPKDGEAYRLMILVAMGEGWPMEQARATLDEGRKVDPTYFPMYVQFARYLLPRWHGKRGDIERFAAETAELLPGDDGLEACARIVAAIHRIDAERELLFFGSYDKALLVKASEVLRERSGGGRNETEFAAVRLKPLLGQEAENDQIWPWTQHRREFTFWCRSEDFAAADDARWFWGSIFEDHDLVFAADSRAVWCGGGYGPSAVNCLDIERGRIIHSLPGTGGGVECLAVDESRGWVVAGITGDFFKGLMLWDLHDPDRPVMLQKDERFRALAISPADFHIATASQFDFREGSVRATEKTVQLLNIRTRERERTFAAPQPVKRLRFSADGKSLIVSASHESVWDVATGQLRIEMPHVGMRPIPDVHCRKILDIDEDGRIWALIEKTKPPPQEAMLVRYAPDAKGWEPVISGLHYPLWVPDLATLSADRNLIALIQIPPSKDVPRIEIEVWDIATGKKIKHFGGHHSHIETMSFSPDRKWLASIGFPTGLVKLWPIEDESAP
jgi:WD40 domain-containing protein